MPAKKKTSPAPTPSNKSDKSNKSDAPPILKALTLRQAGKVVKGSPIADNYAVSPAKDAKDLPPWNEILATLRAAYPGCIFTWTT